MDQNYMNYNYTPVYHQLQSSQEPLPHFHHLTSRASTSTNEIHHQQLPSINNFNTKIEKFDNDDQNNYQRPPPPFYPPLFNSHQFQPMWDNNFAYSNVIPQYPAVNYHPQSFIHRPPPAVSYPNFIQAQQNVQMQIVQQQPQQNDETFNCDVCKRDFTSSAHLKRHVLTKAHVKNAVKSTGCINLSELQERATNQDALIVKTGEKLFQVNFTEVQNQVEVPTSSITDLSEAEVVFFDKELSAIEPSTLANFETQFSTPSPVQQIVSSSSSENGEFHCVACNKTFAKRCYFTQHNKQTHPVGLKPFKCSKCGKKFQLQEQLDLHVQKHEGNKPFKCSQCTKSFNFKTDLKRHIILHTTVKPHVCQQCGKGFIRNDHLLKHYASHKKKMEKLKKICSANGVNI
ncbi:hypothetical protein PVAND_015933 [Polypedilum vanderplanki]|uniref:C2H2-type domain-containing protein n=1 Tax=Polypedilum vanderplanki TaxID=319348 RepID=A0A9J6BED0_POLVA|nr:hypothetical protein PVAND_015933 [Polypedilum vanderplanki]